MTEPNTQPPWLCQWQCNGSTTQTSVSKRPLVHLIWTASQHHLRRSLPQIFNMINLIRGERKAHLCGWGLATYCTWSDCFGGWKGRGRECEIRHVRRVISIEYGEDDAVVMQLKTIVGQPLAETVQISVLRKISFSSQAQYLSDL